MSNARQRLKRASNSLQKEQEESQRTKSGITAGQGPRRDLVPSSSPSAPTNPVTTVPGTINWQGGKAYYTQFTSNPETNIYPRQVEVNNPLDVSKSAITLAANKALEESYNTKYPNSDLKFTQYTQTSPFGKNNGLKSSHNGIDYATPMNTSVGAIANGTVVQTGNAGTYGNLVKIRHDDGTYGYYGHLNGFNVKAGDKVRAGDIIGTSGNTGRSTGPHLHLEVRGADDSYYNQIDPQTYINAYSPKTYKTPEPLYYDFKTGGVNDFSRDKTVQIPLSDKKTITLNNGVKQYIDNIYKSMSSEAVKERNLDAKANAFTDYLTNSEYSNKVGSDIMSGKLITPESLRYKLPMDATKNVGNERKPNHNQRAEVLKSEISKMGLKGDELKNALEYADAINPTVGGDIGYAAKSFLAGGSSGIGGVIEGMVTAPLAKEIEKGAIGLSKGEKFAENIVNAIGNAFPYLNSALSIYRTGQALIRNASKSYYTEERAKENGFKNVKEFVRSDIEKMYGMTDFFDKPANKLAFESIGVSDGAKFVGEISQVVGNMIPSIIASVATKNPEIGLAIMSSSTMGQSANEALKNGATAEQAYYNGLLKGATEYLTEKLFGGIPLLGKGIFGSKADDLVAKLGGSSVGKFLGSSYGKFALELLERGGEGVEGAISSLASGYIDRLTYNDKAELATVQEIGRDALLEILVSFVMNAPVDVVKGISNIKGKSAPNTTNVDKPENKVTEGTKVVNTEVEEPEVKVVKDGYTNAVEPEVTEGISETVVLDKDAVKSKGVEIPDIAQTTENNIEADFPLVSKTDKVTDKPEILQQAQNGARAKTDSAASDMSYNPSEFADGKPTSPAGAALESDNIIKLMNGARVNIKDMSTDEIATLEKEYGFKIKKQKQLDTIADRKALELRLKQGEKKLEEEIFGKDTKTIEDKSEDALFSVKKIPGTDKKYVQADRQVIKGDNPEQWAEDVKNYIDTEIRKGKDVHVIGTDGEILTITADTSGKARFRNYVYDKNGRKRRMTNEEYAAKLRAEVHIDEIGQVSRGEDKPPAPDRKKHPFATDGFNYRTAYFKDFDGTYYRLRISVGKNGGINTIYNIGKMTDTNYSVKKEANAVGGSKAEQTKSAKQSFASDNNNISQDKPVVKSNNMQNSEKNSFMKGENSTPQSLRDSSPKGEPFGEAGKKKVENIAKVLGREVEWYNDETALDDMERNSNGVFIPGDVGKKPKIRINENAENPYIVVLGHECFHSLNEKTKKGIIDFIYKNTDTTSEKYQNWKKSVEDAYKANNKTLSEKTLKEEFAAENMQQFFDNEEFLNRLKNENKGAYDKIKQWVKNLFVRFKNKGFYDLNSASEATDLSERQLRKLADMFEVGLKKEDTNSMQNKEMYSVKRSESAVVEEDFFDDAGVVEEKTADVLLRMPEPPKENLKSRIEAVADYATRKIFDSGNAFAKIGKVVNDDTLYAHYDLAKRGRTSAMYCIEKAQKDINGKTVGKSLAEIFEPVIEKGEEYHKEFSEYLFHMHNVDRMKYDKPVFGWKVTSEMSEEKANELLMKHPGFLGLAEEVYKYVDNELKYAADSGLVSQSYYKSIREKYPHYVPTYRDYEAPKGKGKKGKLSEFIVTAEGGTENLLPILQTLAQKTIKGRNQGQINVLLNRVLSHTVSNKEKMSQFVTRITNFEAGKNDINAFTFYRNGKAVTIHVNDSLNEGIKSLVQDYQESSPVVDAITRLNNAYKASITSWSPMFTLKNFARDIQDTIFYSKDSVAFAKAYPKAWKEMTTGGEMWELYCYLGGFDSGILDSKTGLPIKPKGISKVGDAIQYANYIVEQSPRFAEFLATVENGGMSRDNLAQAMLNSANVTVNFNRSGTVTKVLNKSFVPFLNPSIQGMANNIRILRESKDFKAWGGLIIKATLFGVMPTVINNLMYSDDEDYQNLNQRDKDINYIFKLPNGQFLKIPKGRLLAAMGATTNFVTNLAKGEEVDVDEYLSLMYDNLGPVNPLTSNIAAPVILAKMNRTWYGGEIESQRMEGLFPEERYDSSTSAIAKGIGKALKISPMKIDYVLDAYSGVFGDFILPWTSDKGVSNPAEAFKRAFVIDPVYSNKISQEYYSKKDYWTNMKNSVRNDKRPIAAVVSRYLNSCSEAISNLNNQIKETETSKIDDKFDKLKETRVIKNATLKTMTLQLPDVVKMAHKLYSEAELKEYINKYGDEGEQKYVDYLYREMNRQTFGTEYALQMYNKETYKKAQKVNKQGVSYDSFYNCFFGIKELGEEAKVDDKRSWLMESKDFSSGEKAILNKALIGDKEIDFTNNTTFILSQMSDAAQRKYASFPDMSAERYSELYKAYSSGQKKADKIDNLVEAGMTYTAAENFYKTVSKK